MLIVFFRALVLYSVVFLVIRLMGKKELSKVQPFELAIIIVISDLASAPMSSRGLSLLQIVQKDFDNQKYTVSDIMSQLHEKDIFSIAEVEYGIIETNGNLSIIRKDEKINSIPLNVVEDGKLAESNIEMLGIEKSQVERMIKNKKIKLEDILYAQLDKDYNFVYQLKEKEVKA